MYHRSGTLKIISTYYRMFYNFLITSFIFKILTYFLLIEVDGLVKIALGAKSICIGLKTIMVNSYIKQQIIHKC